MPKMTFLAVALAAVGSLAGAALAQPSAVAERISAADVANVVAGMGATSQLQADEASGISSLVVTTQGGAKFVVSFFDCTNLATATGCGQAILQTAQAAGGVTFDDVNRFNGSSFVTTAVYEPSNQLLIFGRTIYMGGGSSIGNFELYIRLFLTDMQRYVQERRGAGAASVSFNVTPDLRTKIESFGPADAPDLDALTVVLTKNDPRRAILGNAAEIAINNTVDSDFLVE